jgi:hypothetical protein
MSKRCNIFVTYKPLGRDTRLGAETYARFSSEAEAHHFAKTCEWAEIRRTGTEDNGAGVIGQYQRGAPTPEFALASMLKDRANGRQA